MTRRRILILFLIFLAVFSGTVYYVLHGTGASRILVRQILGETIREELFRLDDAEIDLTGGIVKVTKFELKHPKPGVTQSPLVSINKIKLNLETNLLSGVGVPRHVVLDGFHLNLIQGELPEFTQILRVAGVSSTEETMAMPSITVTNGSVRFQIAADRPVIIFKRVQLKLLPLESNSNEFELNGTAMSQLGHLITIRGGGNVKTGEFRSVLTMENIPIKSAQTAAYQKEAADYLKAAGVKGTIKEATLWVDIRNEVDPKTKKLEQRSQFGLNAELVGLCAAPVDFPYQITGATGRIHGTLGQRGSVKFHIEHNSEDGGFTATGKISHILSEDSESAAPLVDVQLDLRNLRIEPRLLEAFAGSRIKGVKMFHSALAPTAGRISAQVQVFNTAPHAPLEINADLTIDKLAARFHGFTAPSGKHVGFPYPMHSVKGSVSIRPGTITLDNITGLDVDNAPFSINGHINIVDGDVRPNMDIRGKNIRFSKSVRDSLAALTKPVAEIYDEYDPRGKGNVLVRLRDVGRGTKYIVDITPTEASAAYYGFPYRVGGLDGLVRITNEGVWIDIKGKNDQTVVSIHGRFLLGPEHGSNGLQSELWVKGTNLPLDSNLRGACAKFSAGIGERWDEFQLGGKVNTEFTMWKEAGEKEFSYDAHADIANGSASLREFPIPVTSLRGDLFVYGTGSNFRCDINPLRGVIANDPDAKLFLQGSAIHTKKGLTTNITTIIRRLRLTPEIGTAIEKAGITTSDAWQNLKLGGFVDVTGRHHQSPTQEELQHDVDIRLREISSGASNLPGPASNFYGEIKIRGNRATFERIEGSIGETKVLLRSGEIESKANETRIAVTIDSESIPVDKRLGNLLSGKERATYLGSDVTGHAELMNFNIEFRAHKNGQLGIEFDGDVTAHDLFVDVGLSGGHSLQHLNGTANLKGSINQRGDRLSGTLKNATFELTNQRISFLTTDFDVDPQRLILHRLQFSVAKGLVKGVGPKNLALEYRFGGKAAQLRASLSFSQLSLNDLLKERGLAHSKVRGLLSGTINIHELKGANFLDMRAEGEVGVNNGRLGQVPIFSALYSHIAEDKRPQFTQAYAGFKIENQKIKLSNIRARSAEIKIKGDGTIEMDGYMDVSLRVPGVFGRGANIFIIPPLIDWGLSKVVSFQLYGYIREPKLSWTYNMSKGRTSLSPIGPAPRRPEGRR